MRHAAVVLALLALLPTTSGAAPPLPVWEPLDVRGGEIAEIAFSSADPDVVYVGIEVNLLAAYRSADGGRSWTRLQGPFDHAKTLAASPSRADVAYIALSESVHTTDLSVQTDAQSLYGNPRAGADTKVVLASGTGAGSGSVSFGAVAVDPRDDRRVAAAVKGGDGVAPVLRTTSDGGSRWTTIPTSLPEITALAYGSDGRLLIGARGVHALDAGRVVALRTAGDTIVSLDAPAARAGLLVAATASVVMASADGGATWRDATGPLRDIHRVFAAPSAPDTWYASTSEGVFRTDDAGASWRDVSGDLPALNVQALAIHPTDPDVALVGTSGLWSSGRSEARWQTGLLAHQGIWRTEDGGATWTRSDAGIRESDVEEIAANPGRDHETWVAARASRGGFRTDDGGHHWRSVQTPTLHYPMRLAFSPLDPDVAFATSWHTSAPFSKTLDGGASWTFVSERTFFDALDAGRALYSSGGGGQNLHLHGLAVDPRDPSVIYVGSVEDNANPAGFPLRGAHVFKSEDGGSTWRESDDGFPHAEATAIHDMLVDPHDSSRVFAATTAYESRAQRGLWRSEDAGASWSEANVGLGSLDTWAIVAHAEEPGRLVLAAGDGIYVSDDGGDAWRRTFEMPATDVVDVASAPEVLYAATVMGVWRSLDFGLTWERASEGLPGEPMYAVAADAAHATLFAASRERGGGIFVARLADVAPVDAPTVWGEPMRGGFGGGSFDGPSHHDPRAPPSSPPRGAPTGGPTTDEGASPPPGATPAERSQDPPPAQTPGAAVVLVLVALAVVARLRRAGR